MTNPFEIENEKIYYVLMNDEGQYSLWPNFSGIPEGWNIVFGLDDRANCLAYIEKNWVDQRPKSLMTD